MEKDIGMPIARALPHFEGYWRHTVGTKKNSTPSQDMKAIDTWLYTDMRDPQYKKNPKPTWLAVANRSVQMTERVLANLVSEEKAPQAYAFFKAFQESARSVRDILRKNPNALYSLGWHDDFLMPFNKKLDQARKLSLILDLQGHPAAFEQIFNREHSKVKKG